MAKVESPEFPQCEYAGNQLTGRRFCRRSDRPQLVEFEICNGCLHDSRKPSELLPVCGHRGERIESIISCTCPRSWQKGVFNCSKYGRCVLSSHNREEMPGVKCCETCPDKGADPASRETATVDQLAIIAVHFNPQRYNLPVRNYWEWRHHLGPLQANLTTIELSFDDHFAIHDSIKIAGGPQNIMWQKEALINEGIRRLPDRYKFVAWIDHDLIFENSEWASETVNKLSNGYDVLQLFDVWRHYNSEGVESFRRQGEVSVKLNGEKQFEAGNSGAPGGAWAARRDYLERIGGLAATNIVGGGDQLACDAWLSATSHYFERYPGPLVECHKQWKVDAQGAMSGKCGYVPGNVKHLYHGTIKNRHYAKRGEIIKHNNFDPNTDVRLNTDGILEWCSDKPKLHREVADYFSARQEDA